MIEKINIRIVNKGLDKFLNYGTTTSQLLFY